LPVPEILSSGIQMNSSLASVSFDDFERWQQTPSTQIYFLISKESKELLLENTFS
jgi:hypothetical protein